MRGVKYINFALLFFVMVSQAQRLRQQQKELRGEDLKGLSKTESLKLQQEALTKGVPKRRLLAIREQQARMRKAEASPEVKELKTLLTTQKTYLNNLKKQLADAETQRDAKRAEIENQPKPHRRSWKRRLIDESNILNSKANALRKVIPNVEKLVSQIDNFRKKAVTAVFVGRGDVAIEMAKSARAFASQVQSNSNNYVSAKVRERRRRISYSRRRRKYRERKFKAGRDLRDLGLSQKEISDIWKKGNVSITTSQAKQLDVSTQKFLGLDIGKIKTFKEAKTFSEPNYVFNEYGQGMSVASNLVNPKPSLQTFLADIRKPSAFEKVTGVDLLTLNEIAENKMSRIPSVDINIKKDPPPTTIQQFKNLFNIKTDNPPVLIDFPEVYKAIHEGIFKTFKGRDQIDISKLATTTGGMSLVTGEEVLVDRTGSIVDVPTGVVGKVTAYKDLTYETQSKLDADIKSEIQTFVNIRAEQINRLINNKFNELQNLADSGDMTAEQANIKLEKFRDNQLSKFEKEVENKQSIIIKGKIKKSNEVFLPKANKIAGEVAKIIDKTNFVPALITGVIMAIPFVVTGPIGRIAGAALTGYEINKAGGFGNVVEGFQESPYTSAGMLLGGISTGGVVGGAKFGKAIISRRKLVTAIDRARLFDKTGMSLTLDKALKKFKIDKGDIPQIKEIMNHAVTVRHVTTSLKAGKNYPKDATILPKVEGHFLEFIDAKGKVFSKVSLGTVTAELKGKLYSRDILQKASGKIKDAHAETHVRTFIAKMSIRKGWKNIEAVNTLEKTAVKLLGKTDDTQLFSHTTDIFELPLTKQVKMKFQPHKEFLEMKDTLKNLVGGRFNELFLDTAMAGKKISTHKGLLVKRKVADILSVDSRLAKGLFTKTDIFVDASAGLGKKFHPPKVPKAKTFRKGDILKLTDISGIHKLAKTNILNKLTKTNIPKLKKIQKQKQKQKQTSIDKNLPKSTAGLKHITKSVAKKIIKEDTISLFGKTKGIKPVVRSTPITITNVITDSRQMTRQMTDTKLNRRYKSKLNQEELNKQFLGTIIGKPAVIDIDKIIGKTIQKPSTKLSQPQIQAPIVALNQLTTTTNFQTPPFPIPPISPPKVPPFRFPPFRKRFPQVKVDKRPYNVFIKGKKIGSNLSKPTAKNFGAYVVDNSIAAQFKIKPTRGKIKQPKFKVPPVFFDMNVNKFRSPRGKKSKRNIYIERKNRRLDTANEVNQITAARFVSSQRKLAGAGKVNIFGTI